MTIALCFGIAGACYDLTPFPDLDKDAGAPCTPDMTTPDACAAEIPDGGEVDADIDASADGEPEPSLDAEIDAEIDGEIDAAIDGGSGEESSP
jgi:hypothetical protein